VTQSIKVALAGAGAFGVKHLDAMKQISGIEVVSLVGRELDKTQEVAQKYAIGHVATELARALRNLRWTPSSCVLRLRCMPLSRSPA
jgi:2-hydroxy-4-carboxymuconate semialdehyde hemiacetal dehydrogenase